MEETIYMLFEEDGELAFATYDEPKAVKWKLAGYNRTYIKVSIL